MSYPDLLGAAVLVPSLSLLVKPMLAYIDPGSGSLILQVIVGTLLGAAVAIKMYWARFKHFVSDRMSQKRRPE